jgi:hypothetical protein
VRAGRLYMCDVMSYNFNIMKIIRILVICAILHSFSRFIMIIFAIPLLFSFIYFITRVLSLPTSTQPIKNNQAYTNHNNNTANKNNYSSASREGVTVDCKEYHVKES